MFWRLRGQLYSGLQYYGGWGTPEGKTGIALSSAIGNLFFSTSDKQVRPTRRKDQQIVSEMKKYYLISVNE